VTSTPISAKKSTPALLEGSSLLQSTPSPTLRILRRHSSPGRSPRRLSRRISASKRGVSIDNGRIDKEGKQVWVVLDWRRIRSALRLRRLGAIVKNYVFQMPCLCSHVASLKSFSVCQWRGRGLICNLLPKASNVSPYPLIHQNIYASSDSAVSSKPASHGHCNLSRSNINGLIGYYL